MSLQPSPFRHLRVPGPDAEDRRRILAAARRAADSRGAGSRRAEEPTASWLERLWFSRAARLSWAACMLLLLVAHLLPEDRRPRQRAAGTGVSEEIAAPVWAQARSPHTPWNPGPVLDELEL